LFKITAETCVVHTVKNVNFVIWNLEIGIWNWDGLEWNWHLRMSIEIWFGKWEWNRLAIVVRGLE